MKQHHFKAKQRFSLRKYAVGTCSVLLGTSLFFVGTSRNAVLAEERIPQLVSHYVEDKDLPESLKAELRWFEENAIQVEEGKDYYFVYSKSTAKLPDTGLFSNAILPVLGTGILLVSLTLIKKRKGASLFLVTVLAVGGTALSVSALENLVELRPALVKTVAGEFLPSPERIEGYEFTGYYFVRENEGISKTEDTKPHSLQVDEVESTSIPSEGTSSLVEVKPELEVTTESVAYDTIHKEDPDLLKGHTCLIQAGLAGERTILTEVTTVDGKEVRQVKSNTLTVEPISEIIAVGTKVESTSTPSEGTPSLVEVKPELEVTTEAVAYDTIHKEDPDLLKGQTRVIQAGVAGERTILTEVTKVDGKETRKVVSNEVTTSPVSEIIAVGTKVESTSIPSEGAPSLVEVKPELEITTESVAYDTLHQEEPDLLKGQTRIIQAGVAGERTILTEVTTVDGKENRKQVSNEVTTAPVTEIIAVGTKVESTSIPSEGTPSLVEVKPDLEVTTEAVAYDTLHQDDPDLLKGETRVIQAGIAGERTILTEVTTVDGKENRKQVSNEVTTAPVTEIIAVGTKVESTSIPSEGAPSLVEVKPELEITTESVAYDTLHQDDLDLLKGQTRIIQAGVAGERTILTEVTKVDGKETRKVVSNEVITSPVSEIIVVGTKVESTSIPSEGAPSLVEEKPELEVTTEAVAYDTIHQEDPDLLKGQTRVIRAGVTGERTILTEVTTVEGKENRNQVSNEVTTAPVTEIIAVGTRVESTSIPSEGAPSLVEVKPELEITTESVAYDTLHQEDPDLLKGQTRIIQAGVAGERTILTEVTTVDGKEVRQVKSNTVTLEPVSEIIAVGTKVESTSTPSEGTPSLVEVKPELEVTTEAVAYDTIHQEDPDLLKGQTRVIRAGVAGERTILTEVTKVDGKETRKVVSNEVTTSPVSEIIAVGTKVDSTSIPSEGALSLVEVKPELEITTESLAYDTIHQDDPDLLKGETRLIRAGVAGERTILTEVTIVDGKEDRQVKSKTVTLEPVSEIIAVGTKVDSTSIPSEGAPSLVGDKPELEVTREPVPYETIRKEDPTLSDDQVRLVQAGVDGERTILTEVTTVDGKENRKQVSNEITTAPIPEIILVGSKKEPLPLPQPKVETQTIPYKTIYQADDSQEVGTRKTKIHGVNRQVETTIRYTRDQTSGQITEASTSKTLVEKVDEIILVGSKPSVETKVIANKTIYEADPTLPYQTEKVAISGKEGIEKTTTTYQVDAQTGQVTERDHQKEVTAPIDKVMKVGNVETVVTPIPIKEERRQDPRLDKDLEKVESQGESGETTTTRVYEVNPQTGELLLSHTEPSTVTKAMKPKVILVGTKENKPHLLPVNTELENAIDVRPASQGMKAVDLLSNAYVTNALKPNILGRDVISKKIELKKTNPTITDEEVKEVLRKEYLERLSIKDALEETKKTLDADLKKVVAHSLSVLGNTAESRAKVQADLEANKEKILLGLTYINRFYNIDFGKTNIRDILAYNPSSFGKKVTSLEWLTSLGSMSYDEMKLVNSPRTFEKYFGKVTDKSTLLDFLDYNRTTFTSMDGDTWLKDATKAIVVEKQSKEKTDENVSLYTKLTSDPAKYGAEPQQIDNRKQYNLATLLGLVNIKEPSIYAITNMATVSYGNIGTYMDTSLAQSNPAQYKAELEKVKALVELTAERQAAYVDTLYRITKKDNQSKLVTNRLIVDTMKKYTGKQNAGIKETWSKEFGPDADKGVKDFMSLLGMYSPSQSVGAEANGVGVRYFIDRVLDDRGSATYSHEMTHLLDRTVLFNNYGRRDGTGAEFYARGIFENSYTPETDSYFNLNFVYDESNKESFYNKTPERFKSAADLKEYMHGSFDVLYTLDYLEAEASRGMSAADKAVYFKQLLPSATSGSRTPVSYPNPSVKPSHQSEEIKALTEADASKLGDVHSLIDNHIVVNRYIIKGFTATGKVDANGYYTVDMFDTIYGVNENDKGMSGDISFRKQAFELMAGLGYYEGFVPYVSNQYKQDAENENRPLSDQYIFEKILAGKTYAQFKKEQMDERIANISKLKQITIDYKGKQEVISSPERMKQLMEEAVKEELAQIKAGNISQKQYRFIETPVQKLKKAIYKAYLKESNEFRNSIYTS